MLDRVLALIAQAGAVAPARVLDVGCGTGELALALAERGFRVTGLDLSSTAITIANRAAGRLPESAIRPTFVVGTFDALPSLGRYDVVVMKYVLPFLGEPGTAIRRAQDLLEPAGALVIITPVLSANARKSDHARSISVERAPLERLLAYTFLHIDEIPLAPTDEGVPVSAFIARGPRTLHRVDANELAD